MMYKHKVELQEESSIRDSFGGVSASAWTKIRYMRVKITPVSGNESFLSMTDFSKTTHKITCRYRQDIKPSMRLSFNDRGEIRIFRILSVINVQEKKMQMEIKATEENN